MKNKLSMIYQSDMAECGLAVLTMVLQYYHRSVSLAELRQQCPVSLSGMSISYLQYVANQYQLKNEVIRVELEELRNVTMPAILHWNLNHFVVLNKVKKDKFIIHDPARGVIEESLSSMSNSFTGIVMEIKEKIPSYRMKLKKNKHQLKFILESVPDIKKVLIKFFIFSIFYILFLLLSPYFLKVAIDGSVSNIGKDHILAMGVGFLWFRMLIAIAKYCKDFCMIKLEVDVSQSLGMFVVRKLLYSPLDYFEKRHLNDVIHRVNSVEQCRQLLFNGLVQGLLDGLLCCVLLFYMFFCSPLLASFSFCFVMIMLPVKYKFIYRHKVLTQEMILNKSEEQSVFLENLRGIQPIKLFLKENDRYLLWLSKYKKFLYSACRVSSSKVHSNNIKDLMLSVEMCLLIMASSLAIQGKFISIGVFYAFLFYRQLFLDALFNCIDKVNDVILLVIHQRRLEDILIQPLGNEHNTENLIPNNFSIQARNLSFQYSPFEPFIIRNLNFTIHEGECVVFVGPSGTGKTTLLKILMGLLTPSEGTVLVGGCHAFSSTCRKHFASVMQNDHLLNGTIAQNISFFSGETDIDQIKHFARLAGVYDDIRRMPMQFQTLVGDMGGNLSGGQKQRILLARALYARPRILFLDEASSHLDIQKEEEVNAAIKSLGITRVMVAHRNETIQMADRLLSLV